MTQWIRSKCWLWIQQIFAREVIALVKGAMIAGARDERARVYCQLKKFRESLPDHARHSREHLRQAMIMIGEKGEQRNVRIVKHSKEEARAQ